MPLLSDIQIETHELLFPPGESKLLLNYVNTYTTTPVIVATCGVSNMNVFVTDIAMLQATITLSAPADEVTGPASIKVQVQIMGT